MPLKEYTTEQAIKERVQSLTGAPVYHAVRTVEDTGNYTDIYSGMVLRLEGKQYYIQGNTYELRFTLEEYPKYWVKTAIELSSGTKKIIKWDFNETFVFKIGDLNIRCYRESEKESEILKVTAGNMAFMQGITTQDTNGNPVKIIDFIRGKSLFHYLENLDIGHREYYQASFPGILRKLRDCLDAIGCIHKEGLFHGDIRNDHILIDAHTDRFRWIDFDLNQDYSDFDIWSVGNILLFSAGKGVHTFKSCANNPDIPHAVAPHLTESDESAFFQYRIMNLKKLFPYLNAKLNRVLMRFSKNTTVFYDSIEQIRDDVDEVLEDL